MNVFNRSDHRSSSKTFFKGASGTGEKVVNNTPENGGIVVQQKSVVINRHPRKGVHPDFLTAVAPNAVGKQLSGCFPGTRLKVMDDIEKWIDSTGGSAHQGRFAWLTGPAGCGKSAVIKALSKRCSGRQYPVANFFFVRDDTTCNHIRPLVASLTYQLSISPGFPGAERRAHQFITSAVDTHPLIFREPIEKQFLRLLIPLIRHMQPGKPVLLLIDGLDECVSEVDQQYLIHMIQVLIAQRNPTIPIKILFASRPEAHLAVSFNQLSQSSSGLLKLSLDNTRYHPEDDIHLFVSACFDDIKRRHRLGDQLGRSWPSDDALNHIVSKSSGQFLYAATVMQFIAKSSTNPTDRLATVIAPRPSYSLQPLPQHTANAFARMDAIFAHVFSGCAETDWEILSNILAAQIILRGIDDVNYNLDACLAPLGIVAASIDRIIPRFWSLMQYDGDKKKLSFYHASLPDFLVHKARAQKYHIDINLFAAKLAGKILRKTDIIGRPSTFKFMSSVVGNVLEPTSNLTSALHRCPSITYQLYDVNDPDLHQSFFTILLSIRNLYFHRQRHVHESLLQTWLRWSLPQFCNHLDVISQGMEKYDITPPPQIRLMMIQESRQERLVGDALRLFSDSFWSGDYDRDSAEASYRAYSDSGDIATLNSAIKNYDFAVEQYRNHQNASLRRILTKYASAVWRRYTDCGQSPDDLDKVICLYTEAWKSWPPGAKKSEPYFSLLNSLARAYFKQYQKAFEQDAMTSEGKRKAFDKAVKYYTELRDNLAIGRDRCGTQIHLGIMFRDKCKLEYTLDSFEIGVQHLENALLEAKQGENGINASDKSEEEKQRKQAPLAKIQAICLLQLGILYDCRYELTEGSTKTPNLTTAIYYYSRARPLLKAFDRSTLPACLYNLSRCLCLRWQQTSLPSDYILAKEMTDAFEECVGDDPAKMQQADDLKNTLLEVGPQSRQGTSTP